MAQHQAEVIWRRGDQDFLDRRYSRKHLLKFDGGAEVAGSSAPQVVPPPYSDPAAVDPEEAFISSLSSCHMLWFLDIAAGAGFRVDEYHDVAVGEMGKNEAGKAWVSRVTLQPRTVFSGDRLPTPEQLDQLHHAAHAECFIAHSVKTEVLCRPSLG
ncbi:OsmC family protein [Chromobacterium violaceum]|uniref:OsmC-like protein n=1 Tax=Chromobacterium violaceum TaxID=536 RepID=A0AAX2M4X3_CHRVL|nr:OsmC family protein [Chromobacterium violaceum]OLZ87120.1 peroxiredoxin [Chromobacterium violaceum]STB71510.1 OsmC-like protein [Chromobacterium violaceum]SUX31512.1 OsmC-like protein [Chromobacterium violaceum]